MKSVFITGSATGIGEGLVNHFQEQGWLVFAGYRNTLPEQSKWYGKENVIPLRCDVTQSGQIEQAANDIGSHTSGQLDVLINNAGYPGNSGVIECPDMDDYRQTMEINFWGPFQVASIFMPLLRKAQGRIINTTSASVYMTFPMGSSYPVAKTALKALTNHMRMEMAPFGVQVATLEPGGVSTPMTALDSSVSENQWRAIPSHLRGQYQRYFLDGAAAIDGKFRFYTPETFARKVYKKMIASKTLKPHYLIGPGVAPLPWLHRLLPVNQVQGIWERMFSAG